MSAAAAAQWHKPSFEEIEFLKNERRACDRILADDDRASAGNGAARDDGIIYRRASEIVTKPIRWLWPGRIARGKVTLLAGNPGLGKSVLTASLAAIVSRGAPWPVDRTMCERGNVIILSAEDDAEDTIRPRLEAAGADLYRVFILDAIAEHQSDGNTTHRGFNLKSDLARLGDLLTELGDVALIVIDPVTAYLAKTDSHVNAEVRALLAPLADLAGEHETAVAYISHEQGVRQRSNDARDRLSRVCRSLPCGFYDRQGPRE